MDNLSIELFSILENENWQDNPVNQMKPMDDLLVNVTDDDMQLMKYKYFQQSIHLQKFERHYPKLHPN